jgi:hypothetical protein
VTVTNLPSAAEALARWAREIVPAVREAIGNWESRGWSPVGWGGASAPGVRGRAAGPGLRAC